MKQKLRDGEFVVILLTNINVERGYLEQWCERFWPLRATCRQQGRSVCRIIQQRSTIN